MPAILPSLAFDHDSLLACCFTPYQTHWILAEEVLHARKKQAFALAEKSVRIGWTFCDAFKNVRKRLRYKNRDYLFATKDFDSAVEYINVCQKVAELFNLTRFILSHGEQFHKVPRLDEHGHPSAFTDEIKMGVIKFDNGSRIMAFSSHPHAMAVHAGDIGLDEFAKHQHPKLLWETAQGRVTWGYDLAVWSSHNGEDTLFHEFALEARASANHNLALALRGPAPAPSINSSSRGDEALISSPTLSPTLSSDGRARQSLHAASSDSPDSTIQHLNGSTSPSSPWNLYYRVTLTDAIELGLLQVMNQAQGTAFTPDEFVADSRARARQEEIFQQSYMCNPLGSTTNHIVEWSAIERCRYDYEMERIHLESDQVIEHFGCFSPSIQTARERQIETFLELKFPALFAIKNQNSKFKNPCYRLGFDVAASGAGDLAVIYIDEVQGDDLWLRALFSCRTEDWHFLQTVLFKFMHGLQSVLAAGDSSGLGRQICWDATQRFGSGFASVNFASKKNDLGFALMNQLSTARKRFPRTEQDIASDYFALRKSYEGSRWVFSEARNTLNLASHCDIAWAGALATYAHTTKQSEPWALVC